MNIKKWLLFSLALVIFLSSAGVMAPPEGKKVEEDKLIRVTIDNQSDKTAYLKLTGPHHYYFVVAPNTKAVYTPITGKYDYLLVACGVHYKDGKVNLIKNTSYIVPECGMNAYGQPYGKKGVDVGRELKLVPMVFTGKAYGTLVLVLTGPSTYVLSLPKDTPKTYTIRKGWYTYKLYGCGRTGGGEFYADRGKHKVFYCP